MTKKKVVPVPVAPNVATAGSVAYPIHRLPRIVDGRQLIFGGVPQTDPCGTTGVLVLLEQTKRAADGNTLFCLRCLEPVAASAEQHEQAAAAARAEGWVLPPDRTLPLTPGDLDEHTRIQLRALHLLEVMEECPPGDRKDPRVDTWHRVRDRLLADSHTPSEAARLGFVDDGRDLTLAGREMALLIVRPEVPPSVAKQAHDARFLDRYSARAKEPKARKPKPAAEALPMVCMCSHGAAKHTEPQRAADVGCNEPGCACKRYVQQRPAVEPKAKRSKKAA